MAEAKREEIPRVTKEEFYPVIGDATAKVKFLEPIWGKEFLEALMQLAQMPSTLSVLLRHRYEGDNPQVHEAVISNATGDRRFEVEIRRTGIQETEAPKGNPLIANYDGIFYRKERPSDPRPLAEEGIIVAPDAPLGVAAKGKYAYWLYSLPGKEFPNGGRITKFLCPPNADGMTVTKGKTTICYVEKL